MTGFTIINAIKTIATIAMLFCIVSGALGFGLDVQIWGAAIGAGLGLALSVYLALKGRG